MLISSKRTAKSRASSRRRTEGEEPASKKYVKQMISRDKETDYIDILPSDSAEVNSAGTITQLTNIAQGDGSNQRLGNSISVSGVRYTGWYVGESTAATTTIHAIRVVLFRWLPDTNVDSPTLAKLFEDTADNQTFFVGDRTLRKKFKVIKDYLYTFNSRQGPNGSSMKLLNKKYIRVNKKVNYNEEATTGKGNLYLLEWGNNATGNEAILGNSRVRVFYKER